MMHLHNVLCGEHKWVFRRSKGLLLAPAWPKFLAAILPQLVVLCVIKSNKKKKKEQTHYKLLESMVAFKLPFLKAFRLNTETAPKKAYTETPRELKSKNLFIHKHILVSHHHTALERLCPSTGYKTAERQEAFPSHSALLNHDPREIHFEVRVLRGSTGFPFWISFSTQTTSKKNSQPNLSKCLRQYPLQTFKEPLAVVKLVLFNLDICPARLGWPAQFTSPGSNQIIITLGYYRLELDLSEWFQSTGIHYQ